MESKSSRFFENEAPSAGPLNIIWFSCLYFPLNHLKLSARRTLGGDGLESTHREEMKKKPRWQFCFSWCSKPPSPPPSPPLFSASFSRQSEVNARWSHKKIFLSSFFSLSPFCECFSRPAVRYLSRRFLFCHWIKTQQQKSTKMTDCVVLIIQQRNSIILPNISSSYIELRIG